MPPTSKVCAECGARNSLSESRCERCGFVFPGPVATLFSRLVAMTLGPREPVTRATVAVCGAMYVFMLLDGSGIALLAGGAPSTALRWGALRAGLGWVEPWRLLSASFVHFGLLHVGANGFSLVAMGRPVEREYGSARFVVALLVSAVAGFALSELWYTRSEAVTPPLTGGISGGLFGLVGLLLGAMVARRDPRWRTVATRVGLYALLFAVALPVNNAAHLGGFLAGLPFGYFFADDRRPGKSRPFWRVAAALLLIASISGVGLSHRSDVWRVQRAVELMRH